MAAAPTTLAQLKEANIEEYQILIELARDLTTRIAKMDYLTLKQRKEMFTDTLVAALDDDLEGMSILHAQNWNILLGNWIELKLLWIDEKYVILGII